MTMTTRVVACLAACTAPFEDQAISDITDQASLMARTTIASEGGHERPETHRAASILAEQPVADPSI